MCCLVLRGKKLGEICTTPNKTESNINSQRANVRRKTHMRSLCNVVTEFP